MNKFAMKSIAVFFMLLLTACATTTTTATKKSPKEISQLYAELGTAALMRSDYPGAVQDLRKAITYDSSNALAHNHLGLAFYSLGKKDLGKQEIERAVSEDPNYSDAYINLGNMAVDEGKSRLARRYYNKALENLEYKFRHRAFTAIAQLALKENNIEEARTNLYQAIEQNPDYCLAHYLMGTIYMRDNNPKRAADEFAKSVVQICANNADGHFQLGIAYLKLNDYDKARKKFLSILDEFPNTAYADHAKQQLRDMP